MNRCAMCDWVLDDEHIFNIKCAVANAENDQLEAEVAEAQTAPMTPKDAAHLDRLVAQGMEIARDVIALKRFEQMVRRDA